MIKEMIKKWQELLMAALEELYNAARELTLITYTVKPTPPMPRFRTFQFSNSISWPYYRSDGTINESKIKAGDNYIWIDDKMHREEAAEKILIELNYNSKRILRALRRIQAAAEWCRRRTEGRKRAAQEMVKQQRKATEKLNAEFALLKLRRQK